MKPVHEMPWLELLDQLRNASEKECADLLESEKHGKRRFNYLMRIFMKYNKLRYQRERRELLVLTGDQEVDGTIKLLLRSPEDTVKHDANIK